MKVSIIIPTFNYAHYIFEAIKSLENQDYPKELMEVIIVDDGSTDDTPQLIKNYTSSLSIIYHYQDNKGKAQATQKGIDLSSGDIIFNLDADDFFYPEKIKQIVAIYTKNPEVNYVGHPAMLIKDGDELGKEKIPEKVSNKILDGEELLSFFLLNRILYGGGSTFSARASSLKKNSIPQAVNMYIDEYLIYEVSMGYQVFLHPKALSAWRIHGKNYSVQHQENNITKAKANISASKAMLEYVNQRTINQKIQRFYALKHLDRYLNFKERFEVKSSSDYQKILLMIFSFNYAFSTLHKYRLIYRFLPYSFIKRLKQI